MEASKPVVSSDILYVVTRQTHLGSTRYICTIMPAAGCGGVYSKHAAHTVDQQLHGLDTHNIKIEGASVSWSGDTTDPIECMEWKYD